MYEKLKSYLADDTVYTALLLIFVGALSYGLGYFAGAATGPAGAILAQPTVLLIASATPPTIVNSSTTAQPVPAVSVARPFTSSQTDGAPASLSGPYVASKSGTKYHLVTCSGAKRIKDENKVFFATKNDAEAAGYTAAANCPGI